MPRSLLVALLTVVVFAAGYWARVWTEREIPIPAPPPPGGEFSAPAPAQGVQAAQRERPGPRRPRRAELAAEIEKMRPQIETFRRRVGAIDSEFDRGMQAVLTAQQIDRYNRRYHRHVGEAAPSHRPPEHPGADMRPISDEEIFMRLDRPLWHALRKITVEADMHDFTRDLQLTAPQQAAVRKLMVRRREEFLALVDSLPPPSLILSDLAEAAQRLATAPPADPGQP